MNFYPTVCIDVGAAGGTPAINRSFKDALHLAFEPQPAFLPELEKELEGLPLRDICHGFDGCSWPYGNYRTGE